MTTIYRPTEAIAMLKPVLRYSRVQCSHIRVPRAALTASHAPRATHSTSTGPAAPSGPSRRAVTVANDTGSVKWGQLSVGEKMARTTQQSVNLVVVAVGVVLTGTISYFLFTDVFSPSSKTAYFNRSTTLIRDSPACQALLGPGPEIAAYGESSWSRLSRNRYMASTNEIDKWGTEHLKFRFYVEGPLGQGTVHVHLSKRPSQNEFIYEELSVDVKGHKRIYLESSREDGKKPAPKIFGARWW